MQWEIIVTGSTSGLTGVCALKVSRVKSFQSRHTWDKSHPDK